MNENLEIEYKMLVSEQEFNQLRDLTGVDQVLEMCIRDRDGTLLYIPPVLTSGVSEENRTP